MKHISKPLKTLKATNDSIIKEFLSDSNYQVLHDGTILTLVNKQGWVTDTWWVKFQTETSEGYRNINYKKRKLQIHRIVYAAFVGHLSRFKVINHKDGNPKNNHYSNLELATASQNQIHSYQVLKRKAPMGAAKLTQEQANEIRKQVAEENKKASELAQIYNVTKTTISRIVNNKTWKST